MPTISIIIPVFNASQNLNKCIQSLLTQTFNDFEILLINDGSTDNSLSICNEYKNKYSFIKVLDKENGGAASARNLGLQNAQGKYICFVDADDYCEKEYLQTLWSNITSSNSDLSMIGINIIYENSSVKESINIFSNAFSTNNKEEINKLRAGCFCNKLAGFQTNKIGMGTPWDKLYVTHIIKDNNILFDTSLKVGEDTLFVWNYLQYVNSFIYSTNNLYNYIIYSNSLSHSLLTPEDFIITKSTFLKYISENNDYILNQALLYTIFRHFKSLLKKFFANPRNTNSFFTNYKILKRIVNEKDFKKVLSSLSKANLSKSELIIYCFIKIPFIFSIALYFLNLLKKSKK